MRWNALFWPGPLMAGSIHSIVVGSKNSILRETDRSCKLWVNHSWKYIMSLPGEVRIHPRFKRGKLYRHTVL